MLVQYQHQGVLVQVPVSTTNSNPGRDCPWPWACVFPPPPLQPQSPIVLQGPTSGWVCRRERTGLTLRNARRRSLQECDTSKHRFWGCQVPGVVSPCVSPWPWRAGQGQPCWWGKGRSETAGKPVLPAALESRFHFQDSVAEKEGNYLLSLPWLRHSKKVKINAIKT